MEEKLEAFAAKCHQILKADSGPSGIEEVRSNLEPLLSDENFVSIYLGPENNEIRKILYEDKELGFCMFIREPVTRLPMTMGRLGQSMDKRRAKQR